MATFTPYGTVWIGRVPFDNSYKHVMSHSSMSAQKAYFESVCNRAFDRSHYTYIRKGQSIKVPFNAEELYSYNYLMYQNANFGTKWFYCFIIDVIYINDNTTELVLELDIWNTWYFNWTRGQCFVEREHVNNDSLFAHTNPEPEMPLRYRVREQVSKRLDTDMQIVVLTAAKAKYDGSTLPSGSEGYTGGVVDGVFTGGKYLVWPRSTGAEGDEYGAQALLKELQTAGAGDAVASVFMISSQFIRSPVTGGPLPNTVSNVGTFQTMEITRPTSFGGYTPRNNKLYCYPYSYARIRDNNGSVSELMWEMWSTGGAYSVSLHGALDPTATCYAYPGNYAGENQATDYGISIPVTVQCSWPYSNFQNWSAQNALANDIKLGVSVAGLVLPAVKGASAAAKVLGATSTAAKAGNAAAATRLAARETRKAAGAAAVQGASEGVGGMGLMAGLFGLGDYASTISRQSKIPDAVRGSASGNTMYQTQLMSVFVEGINLDSEYAEIVDGFFDMYGYQVDRVKVPNLTGRQSWNYVKTSNASFRGTGGVPAQDMAAINAMLDSGVTIWHTSDVGNYSLPNGIV